MSIIARLYLMAVFVLALLIQTQIIGNGYAARRTKIAFTSSRNGNADIYVMDGDGNNERRLTVNPTNDDHPAWSPDGMKIVYDTILVQEDHDLAPGGITVMDADGSNKRLLKNEGGAHPSWSPDGKRIVYTYGQIYVMDADGRNSDQLTHDLGFKRMPSWSPDGRSIANLANHRIWVMDSNGKNHRRLTKMMEDDHPTWSPQSDAIAFDSSSRDNGSGIYFVDATNGAVSQVIHVRGRWDYEPDWLYPGGPSVSPTGSQIAIWGRLKNLRSGTR